MHGREANAWSALLLETGDATEQAIRDVVDLSPRELAALVLVRNRPGCTVDWLHARLGLTQSGAVRLLHRLQERDLVIRTRERGRHEVALTITAAGEDVVARGTGARARVIDDALSDLSARDRATLAAILRRAVQRRPRSRDEGDEACRLCDWRACTPTCPMERSVAAPGSTTG